ncbi:uncharacterized protein LOC124281914 isoform X2 [Haliotis rubra]|nr:uncharacterized protein LOC124281914 isoform X2 [Haliotis rubra]
MPSNLEEKLKKAINKNYVQIINTLDPKTVLTHLKETGILTVGGYDTYYEELNNMLTHGKTKQDINIRLLDILYTRDKWWIAFLKALHQCQLQNIIGILEGALSEREVYRLHREIGEDCRPRNNGRPPRSDRRSYIRDRQPSDTESDLGSQTDNDKYNSLPDSRSQRKTSPEVDQEVPWLNSPKRYRSDCNAAPDAIPPNELSWTQESHGYVPNGDLQHPEEQDDPSHLHLSEPRAAQTQTSMRYENGSSHKRSFHSGPTQSYPGYRPAVGKTVLARSSSAPSGPQHSDDLWHSSPRQSHNPSNAFRGSRQRGQGQVSSGQLSPAITSPSALSDQATRQDRAIEGGPRTSGPLGTQTCGPQSDRPTSCNDHSSLAPLSRQEKIHVNFNTPLSNVPMKVLTLLHRLDHDQKWSELGCILTDKFLSQDYDKILTSNQEEPKTKQVLDFFKATEGERATLGRLITALQKMKRRDILYDIKELTGLTFQDEEDEINEHTRKNSWAGTSSNMVDLDIPTPDITPANVSSAARADAIGQFEQSSISSSTLPVTNPNKSKDEAQQSCIRTTEGEVSQSSFTGTRSGMYTSNQIILSQLEEEKKLEEALQCENRRNQNRPVESPNEEHPIEPEHGNPPCLESDSSDENNLHQNSSNNAEGGATKMENAKNQDTKPKPELESKVINTRSSDSPNRDAIASTNQQPKPCTTPAAASSSPLPSSMNSTGTEADLCQNGQTRIFYPPELPVHAKDEGSPTSEKLSTSFKAYEPVSPGQLPNFDKIQPVSLESSGRSNTSQSIHGHNVAASNNPNHLLGPDSGVTAGTHPKVGDKTSPNSDVAHHETMPKTVADSSDDSIENGNTAPKLISGQQSSSVEATTPPEPTGATGSLGPDLDVTSDGSVCFVGTLGSSILDNTQRYTYPENSEDIGERHILTMSEASVCPSSIAKYENKVLQQSIYYERMTDTKGCDEGGFISLGESVEEEEEVGELASGHTEVKEKSCQGQGHSGAEGSRSINGGLGVPDGTATADSRSIAPAANGTGVMSSAASPPLKGASASSTTGCTSSSADGDTSTGHAGTSANTNRGTSFSSVIYSGLKLVKFFTIATDVNKFYSS